MHHAHFIRASLSILAAGLLVFASACAKKPEKKPLSMDPSFSVNVMPVPTFWPRDKFDWPDDEDKKAVHQAAYAKYDKPDFIRKVWTFDDRIVTSQEMEEGTHMVGKRPEPLVEWIYLDREFVLRFKGTQEPEKRDLSDQLAVVCIEGDPNNIDYVSLDEQTEQETWQYWTSGMEYTFVEGDKTKERRLHDGVMGATGFRGKMKWR